MSCAGSCWDDDGLGLAVAGLGIPHVRPVKYFCSQFVADVLERTGALTLPCHPSLIRPEDFARMPGFRVVYRGPLAGSDRRRARPAEA